MRRRLGRFVLALLVTTVVLFVGLNGLLQTSWPLRWLNADPDHLHVDYRNAWTLWPPFSLHLDDLVISFQDVETQVELRADHLDGVLSPWALRSLRLEAHDVAASGVVFRLRPRPTSAPPPGGRSLQPDIAAFDDAPASPGEQWPALVTLALTRVTLTDVREVWVSEVRTVGNAIISGSMTFEARRSLSLDEAVVTSRGATVTRGPEPLLALDALDAKLTLERLVFETAAWPDARKLSADVSLVGVVARGVLGPAGFAAVPWLAPGTGDGPVTAALHVVRGVVQPSSRLHVAVPRFTVGAGPVTLQGGSVLDLSATERAWQVDLVMASATVTGGVGVPRLDVERLEVVAQGATDLTEPLRPRVLVTAHGGRARDVRAVNRLLDPASGLRVVSGAAHLDATFAYDLKTGTGDGALRATVSRLELESRIARLSGRCRLELHLRSFDTASGRLHLDGSSLELLDATVFADRRRYDGFWLKVRVPGWAWWTAAPRRTQATVELELQHLQPVMGIVAAQVELPFPIRLMSDHREVSSAASITITGDGVDVRGLHVHAKALEVWADVQLNEKGVWGAALVDSWPVVAAIEFKGTRHEPVLSDAAAWFRGFRARHRGE